MENAVAYYVEANVMCFIIFGIMLVFDLTNVDRQKKQVMFDYVLISFMLYLVTDTLRIEVAYGALPANTFTVVGTTFLNYIMGVGISYTWLRYVLAAVKAHYGMETGRKTGSCCFCRSPSPQQRSS